MCNDENGVGVVPKVGMTEGERGDSAASDEGVGETGVGYETRGRRMMERPRGCEIFVSFPFL